MVTQVRVIGRRLGRGASIILGIHKLLDNDPLLSKLVERFVDCPFGLFWTYIITTVEI
jgi:hypothetical protein